MTVRQMTLATDTDGEPLGILLGYWAKDEKVTLTVEQLLDLFFHMRADYSAIRLPNGSCKLVKNGQCSFADGWVQQQYDGGPFKILELESESA